MKIANRLLLLITLIGTSYVITPVFAAGSNPAMPNAAPVLPPVTQPGSTSAPAVKSPAVTASQAPEIKLPDMVKPQSGQKDKKDKDIEAVSVKVPDSVKDVVKHLSSKTEDVTLDDLNAAREAIAKLDALIDIEKRLADLDKIRSDREKENDKKVVEALPKTALTPPPSFFTPPPAVERPTAKPAAVTPPAPPKVEVTVIRIEGSNNRYGALIKEGDNVHMVHAGDHLSDGSVVLSVSTQGVQLQRDKATQLAQVKDVHGVFGDSP